MLMHHIIRCLLKSTALVLLATGASQAQSTTTVDLELVLAVDVSYSMDIQEQRLQREGYVQAFRSRDIHNAISQGSNGRIAVSYIEWAGVGTQRVLIPWTLMNGPESANAFADTLTQKPFRHDRRTSISGALEYARDYFRQSPYKGLRRVIDISGDGPNNSGRAVEDARVDLLREGFIINGLPIIIRPSTSGSRFDIPNLDDYYARCVIGGPGAFMIPIRSLEEFLPATRQKLLQEIADLQPSPPHRVNETIKVQFTLDGRPKADCMVGEKRRRGFDFWDNPP